MSIIRSKSSMLGWRSKEQAARMERGLAAPSSLNQLTIPGGRIPRRSKAQTLIKGGRAGLWHCFKDNISIR
jgi:hypothetical protein